MALRDYLPSLRPIRAGLATLGTLATITSLTLAPNDSYANVPVWTPPPGYIKVEINQCPTELFPVTPAEPEVKDGKTLDVYVSNLPAEAASLMGHLSQIEGVLRATIHEGDDVYKVSASYKGSEKISIIYDSDLLKFETIIDDKGIIKSYNLMHLILERKDGSLKKANRLSLGRMNFNRNKKIEQGDPLVEESLMNLRSAIEYVCGEGEQIPKPIKRRTLDPDSYNIGHFVLN